MGYTFQNNDLLLGRYSGSFFKEQVITPNSGSIILFDKNLNPRVVTTSSLYFNKLSASNLYIDRSINAKNGTSSLAYISSSFIEINGKQTVNGFLQLLPVNAVQISPNKTASYIYTSGSTNDLYFTQYNGPYTNTTRLRWLEGNLYTGILNGGVLSSTVGSTTFNITAGSGIIVAMNASTSSLGEPYPTVKYVTWPSYTNTPIQYSGSAKISYVGIDNTGQVIQQTSPWGSNDINQWDESINLGTLLHLSNSKSSGVFNSPQISYGTPQKSDDFFRAFGPLKVSGHTLTYFSASSLGLNRTVGNAYREGSNYTKNANHPNTVTDPTLTKSKIYRYYVSGSTPVIDTGILNNGYPVVDPTKYLITSTGQLTTVPGGKYTLQRAFWVPNSPTQAIIVYYGNEVYNSLDTAIANKDDESFTESSDTSENAIFLGWIALSGNASNLADTTQARFVQGGLFRSVGGVTAVGTTPFSNTLAGLSDVALSSPAVGDLLVYGASTQWNNTKTLNGTYTITSVNVGSDLSVNGNTTIGNAASDTLIVTATSTFNSPATFNSSVTFNQLTGSISGSKARFGQITGSELRVNGDIRLGTTTLIQPTKPSTTSDGYNLSIFAGDGNGSTQTGGDLILRGGYGVDGSGSVRIRDNLVIGDAVANQDSLTVYSITNFVGKISGSSIRITGNTTIGDASSDTLKIFATTTFNGPLTSSNFRVNGRLHVSSSAAGAAFIVSTTNQGAINETNAALIVTGSRVGINTDDVDYNLEVNGSFAATTKSFVIDYKDKPGSKLVHASLEGPEHGVYVRGNTTSSKVFLPEYWSWLVNDNNISVQLTSNKRYQELFVENVVLNESGSYFTVKERGIKGWLNRIFKKSINYSYVVHAERKDVPPLKTEIKKRKTKKRIN